jgi:hypothetical protein
MEDGQDRADHLDRAGRDNGVADRDTKNATVLKFLKEKPHSISVLNMKKLELANS